MENTEGTWHRKSSGPSILLQMLCLSQNFIRDRGSFINYFVSERESARSPPSRNRPPRGGDREIIGAPFRVFSFIISINAVGTGGFTQTRGGHCPDLALSINLQFRNRTLAGYPPIQPSAGEDRIVDIELIVVAGAAGR